jgi:hypothetical protein
MSARPNHRFCAVTAQTRVSNKFISLENMTQDFDRSTFRLAVDHPSGSDARSEGARHAMEGDHCGALHGSS